jgi:hypothetical protein
MDFFVHLMTAATQEPHPRLQWEDLGHCFRPAAAQKEARAALYHVF